MKWDWLRRAHNNSGNPIGQLFDLTKEEIEYVVVTAYSDARARESLPSIHHCMHFVHAAKIQRDLK